MRFKTVPVFLGMAFVAVPGLVADTNELIGPKHHLAQGIAYCKEREWDKAISELSNALRLAPEELSANEWRGCAYFAKGELDKAIGDFDQVIRLNPTNANAFLNRGNAHGVKLELKQAIDDLNECMRLSPQNGLALALRGQFYAQNHEFKKAVQDYDEAIRLDAKNDRAYNGLSWLRATCPVAKMRSSEQAVEGATKACELTDWRQWQCINTLAAAFAQAGDFDKALKYQKQAMSMSGISDNDRKEMQHRLALYKRQQPFRETQKLIPAGTHAETR